MIVDQYHRDGVDCHLPQQPSQPFAADADSPVAAYEYEYGNSHMDWYNYGAVEGGRVGTPYMVRIDMVEHYSEHCDEA